MNESGNQTIYFYPSEGYEVSRIIVNGEAIAWDTESYTLEDIWKDMDVEVTFVPVISAGLDYECPLCTKLGFRCIRPLC